MYAKEKNQKLRQFWLKRRGEKLFFLFLPSKFVGCFFAQIRKWFEINLSFLLINQNFGLHSALCS